MSFPLFQLLVSMPSEGGDGEWVLLAIVTLPLYAMASGALCALITRLRQPRRLKARLLVAAVVIGATLLLALAAHLFDSPSLSGFSALCWLASAVFAVPAASAPAVSAWMARRSPRAVKWSRIVAAALLAPVIAVVAKLLAILL